MERLHFFLYFILCFICCCCCCIVFTKFSPINDSSVVLSAGKYTFSSLFSCFSLFSGKGKLLFSHSLKMLSYFHSQMKCSILFSHLLHMGVLGGKAAENSKYIKFGNKKCCCIGRSKTEWEGVYNMQERCLALRSMCRPENRDRQFSLILTSRHGGKGRLGQKFPRFKK